MHGESASGLRVKIGLEALNTEGEPVEVARQLANKHQCTLEHIANCKAYAADVHKRFLRSYGRRYYTDQRIADKPTGLLALYKIGPCHD